MTVHINLPDLMGLAYPKEPDMTHSERTPNDVRADNGMNAEPAREMPPIDRALRRQSGEIESLVDEISALLERLNPILTPEDEVEGETVIGTDRRAESQIACILDDHTQRLMYQVRRLNQIRHRVEI